ncbi:MAG: dihydrofolate reductase [Bacteroidetes bacterium]|nr:dihydrofolate reductase [Bacteroidota bacterium]
MFSIIVAIANHFAIGKDNRLLCHIPGDLKRFKQITAGHTVIMGKKTWESLPNRPLTNRVNMVITDIEGEQLEGALMAYSIEDAVNKADKENENFIIGGGTIYRQFFPLADRLYLTRVNKDFEADTFFPVINFEEWTLISEEPHPEAFSTEGFDFNYQILERKKNSIL